MSDQNIDPKIFFDQIFFMSQRYIVQKICVKIFLDHKISIQILKLLGVLLYAYLDLKKENLYKNCQWMNYHLCDYHSYVCIKHNNTGLD